MDSNIATVNITVNAVNDAPVAVDDMAVTDEDTALEITAAVLKANDTDMDNSNAELSVTAVSNPASGTVSLAGGTITFTPDVNASGMGGFDYTVSDGNLNDEGRVIITINAVNDAPVITEGTSTSVTMSEDGSPTSFSLTLNVMDMDTGGGFLTWSIATPASHGTASASGSGLSKVIDYTPTADYNGPDSFVVQVSDGISTDTITVNVTITAVNDAPVITDIPDQTIAEGGSFVTISLDDYVSDVDNTDAEMTWSVSGNTALTVSIVDRIATITIPNADWNGTETITFKATDPGAFHDEDAAAFTVTAVNDAPVAVDDAYSTSEDTVLNVSEPGVLGNDSDVDGNPLTAILVDAPAHGALTLNANGSFTYTPNALYHGSDSFTYNANDGTANSNVATVIINVNSVNYAPVCSNVTLITDEDISGQTDPSCIDVDTDPLTYAIVIQPTHGIASVVGDKLEYTPAHNFNGSDSFTYTANDGTVDGNTATVTVTVNAVNDAPVANVQAISTDEDTAMPITLTGSDAENSSLTFSVTNPAHGTLSGTAPDLMYTPAANYHGSDSFTFTVNDGTVNSAPATVSITINAVNDAPVAVENVYATLEDTVLDISVPGVLGNDSDVEGDPLTAILISDVSHGTLTFNADGSFTYKPAALFNGSDSFTYKANDGTTDSNTATVTINVSSVNNAPTCTDISLTTDEDISGQGTPLCTDPDEDVFSVLIHSDPDHGSVSLVDGKFVYIPEANYFGPDLFTYSAFDGSLGSNIATVSITVNAVNDAPACQPISQTIPANSPIEFNLICTDVDNTTLSYQIITPAGHGTTSVVTDKVTYSPDLNYVGTDTFTYQASDGNLTSNTALVSMTMTSIWDCYPLSLSHTGNGTTPIADPLKSTVCSTNGEYVAGELIQLNTANPDAGWHIANWSGTDHDATTADVNTLTMPASAHSVSVNYVLNNTPPIAGDNTYNTDKNVTLNVPAPGVLGNDTDTDPLTALKLSDPLHGTLTFNSNGSFTYVPATGYTGDDTFTYKANDGKDDSNTATVTIHVNEGTPPPPLPSSFFGEIHIFDNAPVAGNKVEIFVPGVSVPIAIATIISADSTLVYTADVPGDIIGTPAKEGGLQGETLTFKIGDRVVASGFWHSGSSVRLDIHPPQAIPGEFI